jgi:hypothetical protein
MKFNGFYKDYVNYSKCLVGGWWLLVVGCWFLVVSSLVVL